MNTIRLSNITLGTFRRFLFDMGCTRINNGTKGRGGHETWTKEGLSRPIILQAHVDPVPIGIVMITLRELSVTRKDFEKWLLSQ